MNATDSISEDDTAYADTVDEAGVDEATRFDKVRLLVGHVYGRSQKLLIRPKLAVSIDEIIIRFTGGSGEIHRMKTKAVEEGYKWFVGSDSRTGYICYSTPDARLDARRGVYDCEAAGPSEGKTQNMMVSLVNDMWRNICPVRGQLLHSDEYCGIFVHKGNCACWDGAT